MSECIVDSDVRKAIDLSRETYCPVWAMLKNNIEILYEARHARKNEFFNTALLGP